MASHWSYLFSQKLTGSRIKLAWELRKHTKASSRCVVSFLAFSRQIHSGSHSFSPSTSTTNDTLNDFVHLLTFLHILQENGLEDSACWVVIVSGPFTLFWRKLEGRREDNLNPKGSKVIVS